MSKILILQLGLGFLVLSLILMMFRKQIFEPPYQDYLHRILYPKAKVKNSNTILISRDIKLKLISSGINISPVNFYFRIYIAGLGLIFVCNLIFHNIYLNIFLAIIIIFFVPGLLILYFTKQRLNKFRDNLPNALDAIIRGAKAGLTANDCIQLVAADSAEPIRSEFRSIVQNQMIGMTLTESFEAMADRLGTKETRLLSFVMSVQQQSGGNLSEALGNLAHAIRSENAMRERIKTVTTEGKTTAVFLSMLPIATYNLLMSQFADRMQLLFETTTGNLLLALIIFLVFTGITSIIYTVNMKI